MDLGFCGIIDIVIVLMSIILIIVGYKKGFIKKAIGFIGILVAIIIAFMFCKQLANCFVGTDFMYNQIYESIYDKAISAFTLANGEEETIKQVLINMEMPEFFAGLFAKVIGEQYDSIKIATSIALYFTDFLMTIICFFIIFVGVILLTLIFKLLATILRENAIIRFLDGILGIVFYLSVFFIILYIAFTIVRFMENADYFVKVKEFLDVDMMLNDPDKFRLSKFLYHHNVLYSLLHIFF